MTLDLTVAPPSVESTLRRQIVLYTGPATYATGGDPLDPADFRMGKVFAILGVVASGGTTPYLLHYDVAASKIMWFVASTGLEAGAITLSGETVRMEVVGQ